LGKKGDIMKKVATVTIRKQRTVFDYIDYDIIELDEPTKSGSTHAAVDLLGETVMLLSTDEEGYFIVDQKAIVGEIDCFYREESFNNG
jgi:hypothetical protein